MTLQSACESTGGAANYANYANDREMFSVDCVIHASAFRRVLRGWIPVRSSAFLRVLRGWIPLLRLPDTVRVYHHHENGQYGALFSPEPLTRIVQ